MSFVCFIQKKVKALYGFLCPSEYFFEKAFYLFLHNIREIGID